MLESLESIETLRAEVKFVESKLDLTNMLLDAANDRFDRAMKLIDQYAEDLRESRKENAKLRTELREFQFGSDI